MRLGRQCPTKLTPLLAVVLSPILCVPGSLHGQTELPSKGGMSFATLGGSDVGNADSRTGLRLGASAILPRTTSLGLELGAGYAAKRATEEDLAVGSDLALGYVEAPPLLRFTPSVEGTISPHFSIGPAALRYRPCWQPGYHLWSMGVGLDLPRFHGQ